MSRFIYFWILFSSINSSWISKYQLNRNPFLCFFFFPKFYDGLEYEIFVFLLLLLIVRGSFRLPSRCTQRGAGECCGLQNLQGIRHLQGSDDGQRQVWAKERGQLLHLQPPWPLRCRHEAPSHCGLRRRSLGLLVRAWSHRYLLVPCVCT